MSLLVVVFVQSLEGICNSTNDVIGLIYKINTLVFIGPCRFSNQTNFILESPFY